MPEFFFKIRIVMCESKSNLNNPPVSSATEVGSPTGSPTGVPGSPTPIFFSFFRF